MDNKLNDLVDRLQSLEKEVSREIQRKEADFFYKVRKGKVRFTEEAQARHRKLAKRLRHTIRDSKVLVVLTAPLIWACLLPLLTLDGVVSVYQSICFPIYGIPKVRRKDYIVVDRHRLSYLNPLERVNCIYCGYANGLLAYLVEVAGRTEQFWCPIKHALRVKSMHSRYREFFDYGNAEDYRTRVEEIRRKFDDLE